MTFEKSAWEIYDADEIYAKILHAYEDGAVKIDLSAVHQIDMSIIQLLIAAKQSCDESKVHFELTNVNNEIEAILKKCACDFLLEAQ